MKDLKTDINLNGNDINNVGNMYTKTEVDKKIVELTQAEYDALSDEEKNNGTIYLTKYESDNSLIPSDFEMLGFKNYSPTGGTHLLGYTCPTGYAVTNGDVYEFYITKNGKVDAHGKCTIIVNANAQTLNWVCDTGALPSDISMLGSPGQILSWGILGYCSGTTVMSVEGTVINGGEATSSPVVTGTNFISAIYNRLMYQIYMKKIT